VMNPEHINRLLVDVFLEAHSQPPQQIVLDVDVTDDPLHGQQEGRFFHGYYREYCYLPLYIFCGEYLLCAWLRPSNADPSDGAWRKSNVSSWGFALGGQKCRSCCVGMEASAASPSCTGAKTIASIMF
jgi:Transposase DDE domain group 1